MSWWGFISISAKRTYHLCKKINHGYEFMSFQCWVAANRHAAVWRKWCVWHSWGKSEYLPIFVQQNAGLSLRQESPADQKLCNQGEKTLENLGKRCSRSPVIQLNCPSPLFHFISLWKRSFCIKDKVQRTPPLSWKQLFYLCTNGNPQWWCRCPPSSGLCPLARRRSGSEPGRGGAKPRH